MNEDRIYSFIGLSTKAGRNVSGEELVEKAIKHKKAILVIVAKDASNNSKKSIFDSCKYYNVDVREFGTKDGLGTFTGKSLISSVAICDKGFANKLLEMLNEYDLKTEV